MGIAKLYSQSGGGNSFKINAMIKSYYVAANETITKGDFIELDETGTQVRKTTTSDIYGVAKTSGAGGSKISAYVLSDETYVTADGKTFETSNGDLFLLWDTN